MSYNNMVVKDFSREACIISKDESLSEALRAMKKCETDRVVLKSKNGEIAGIATKYDIMVKLATERTRMTEPSSWRISGFMSYPVITVESSEKVGNAARVMDERGITGLPLKDDSSLIFDKYSIAELLVDDKTSILDISRTPPVTLRLTDRVLHARMKIMETGISFLPVMGDEKEFVGVVGIDEILDIFIRYYETSRKSPKHLTELGYLIVGDAVKLRPPMVSAGGSVGDAAKQMLKTGYRGVVVVDNTGKPVGIVTGRELIRHVVSNSS